CMALPVARAWRRADARIVRPGVQPAPRLQLATDPGQPSPGPEYRCGDPVPDVRGAGPGRHPAVTGPAHHAKPQAPEGAAPGFGNLLQFLPASHDTCPVRPDPAGRRPPGATAG